MKNNIVKDKSFDFALEVVRLYKYLVEHKREYVLSKQLLRSGTSMGALIREAEHAERKADFIHKLSISLKEANESSYWIQLLYKSEYIEEKLYSSILASLDQILRLLTLIIKTSKQNR